MSDGAQNILNKTSRHCFGLHLCQTDFVLRLTLFLSRGFAANMSCSTGYFERDIALVRINVKLTLYCGGQSFEVVFKLLLNSVQFNR